MSLYPPSTSPFPEVSPFTASHWWSVCVRPLPVFLGVRPHVWVPTPTQDQDRPGGRKTYRVSTRDKDLLRKLRDPRLWCTKLQSRRTPIYVRPSVVGESGPRTQSRRGWTAKRGVYPGVSCPRYSGAGCRDRGVTKELREFQRPSDLFLLTRWRPERRSRSMFQSES